MSKVVPRLIGFETGGVDGVEAEVDDRSSSLLDSPRIPSIIGPRHSGSRGKGRLVALFLTWKLNRHSSLDQ